MIVVFGTVCLDRVRRVARLPHPGEYVDIDEETITVGGEATNTIRALRAWGAESVLIGPSIGIGAEAELLTQLLQRAGLGDALLPVGNHPAAYCDIYVTPDGERTMFGHGFREMKTRSDLSLLPDVKQAWFAADMNLSESTTRGLAIAGERGWRRYAMDLFDPVPHLSPGDVWQSSTDWTGTRADAAACSKWVQEWSEKIGCLCILTDGPRGMWVAVPGQEAVFGHPYTAPKTLDSTGAGDRFRAGMLYCLDQKKPLGECIAFAAAASALKCGYVGAAEHTDPADQIQHWACRQPGHDALVRIGELPWNP